MDLPLLARRVTLGFGNLLLVSGLLWGCGSDSPGNAAPCVEGTTLACVCAGGGSGSQTCAGGGFGACDCGLNGDVGGLDANDGGATDGGATDAAVTDSDVGPGQTDANSAETDVAQADAVDGPDTDGATDAGTTDAATSSDTAASTKCASDKDCKDAGKICDPLTKACVDCLADSDCGPLQHCKSLFCVDFTPCSNSLGCVAATGPDGAALPICDAQQAECVACLSSNDCPANSDCIQKDCVPFTPCNNSKDCLITEVCNTTTGRCAQCLGNNDCGSSQLCESGQCRDFVACSSDKQCTPLGLLCDPAKGKCSQCLKNTDCPEIYHCTPSGVAGTGQCTLDVCAQGQGACSGNAKVTCNAVGSGFGAPVACPAQTTCVAPGGKPECKPWVCTPGTACDGDKAVVCSEDGLQVVEAVDCAAEGKKCAVGACLTTVCAPGQVFCDGQTKKYCSPDGLSVVQSQPCGAGKFCEAGECKVQVCVPGEPVCDGNAVRLCNASGSGFASSGGKDCALQGEVCNLGSCTSQVCNPSPSPYCENNSVVMCDPSGLFSIPIKACPPSHVCKNADCAAPLCTPSSWTCAGKSPALCSSDGTYYEAIDASCPDTEYCEPETGTCEANLCGASAVLPLPKCAMGSCTQCQTKCPLQEICVDGTTYKNDCEAICALKSYDWPANYQISPKKCPDCAACANVELKCDTAKKKCVYSKPGAQETLTKTCATNADCVGAKAVCATLKGGAKITVELPCDVECLELQPNPNDPTKTIAPTAGACKSACSQPPPNGGGCSNTKYQPVCAKEDGKTYAGECHMQNCDTSGCYPIGATTASAQCVADAMTVECVGECFEDAGGPQCDKACNPTCGILPTGKGQSFRNACLAGVKNAKVGNCDGISTTDADICSAEELYKAKGCCPDVDYTVVQPICAARQSEKEGELDKWVTFRSQAEFDCLTKGDNLWIFKYQGACICNCSLAGPEVCGADGNIYANKCQAECFGQEVISDVAN